MADVKIFTENVDYSAIEIIKNIGKDPHFDGCKIRIMPDTHAGEGIVVGFTSPVSTSINPEHIGSDIGCGIELMLFDNILDKEHYPIFEQRIRNAIPMGKDLNKNREFDLKDFCKFVRRELVRAEQYTDGLIENIPFSNEKDITLWCKSLNIDEKTFYKSIGTLGGGNHFIELDYNQEKNMMGITVHTGSRSIGQKVCKKWANKSVVTGGYLSDKMMSGYLTDMVIAQAYAKYNRKIIMDKIAAIYKKLCKGNVTEIISSVHNYLDFSDMIIRKGAIRSYVDELMVIPFNMRDGLAVCVGKSNEDWNCSAPHGAGRLMSRNKAKENITIEEFRKSMEGIYSTSVTESNIDESPMAYKGMDGIINDIEPTCEILYFMKPVINIKA